MSFSSEPVIIVREATIFQEQQTVLSQVSFEVGKGEFVYIVGRTGSGKSSLLKTLYADLSLRLGFMQVAGIPIREISRSQIPELRRKLGIVFQDFQLLPDRTVGENLVFVMKATGWRERGKIKARLAEVLMRVGLGSVENKYPHQLSGGEQQRVVIARELLNEPPILLADEPTGNLDPEVADGIFKLFQEINRSGTAVVMATHNHGFVQRFPHRVLKCERGKMVDSQEQEVNLSDGQFESRGAAMAAPTVPAWLSRAAGITSLGTSKCCSNLSNFLLTPPPMMMRSGHMRSVRMLRYLLRRLPHFFQLRSSSSRTRLLQ